MKLSKLKPLFLNRISLCAVFIFIAIPRISANCKIESVTRCTAKPMQYGRVDFTIMMVAEWTNSPYRVEEVQLDLNIVSPMGHRLVVPAYYEAGAPGLLSTWKVRFCPVEPGQYHGTFSLCNGSQVDTVRDISFNVTQSGGKGFIHVGDNWTFKFDNGGRFRGIGENIAWESRSRDDSHFFGNQNESPRYNYEYMVGTLAENGGNFFRTWMCPWNLPLEWKTVGNTSRYESSSNYFNPSAERRMDQLIDLAESCDAYIMLTLDNSGDFQGRPWQRNNYNTQNNGTTSSPEDFFTSSEAKAQYKDKLRYLVARWGYSPHIAAWEFFNEIDNLMYGLPDKIPDSVVTAWHTEMSDYLKRIDPYDHLITTSISHREVSGLYDIPSIAFNQVHIYGHDGEARVSVFPKVLRSSCGSHNKPFVIGECGFEWDWSKNFDDVAPEMDYDFKKSLWLGLFSPTPILPMSWWWEYFDRRGTSKYIKHVRSVLDQMLAAGFGSFADTECQWSGAPAERLAVNCGPVIFVLINNDNTNSVTGDVSLPGVAKQEYEATAYEPEQNTTNAIASLKPGAAKIAGVTVPPRGFVILKLVPKQSDQPMCLQSNAGHETTQK